MGAPGPIRGSSQIVPRCLPEMLKDQHPQKAQRAMQAMLRMKKRNINAPSAG